MKNNHVIQLFKYFLQGPNLIIHHEDKVLDEMNEWCVEQHGKSGLTNAVKKSQISMAEAEAQVGGPSRK